MSASNESIYQWIVPPPVEPEKPPLYRAKASPHASLAGSTFKPETHAKGWGNLGAELRDTVRPERFLRAHEKTGHIDSGSIRTSSFALFVSCSSRFDL